MVARRFQLLPRRHRRGPDIFHRWCVCYWHRTPVCLPTLESLSSPCRIRGRRLERAGRARGPSTSSAGGARPSPGSAGGADPNPSRSSCTFCGCTGADEQIIIFLLESVVDWMWNSSLGTLRRDYQWDGISVCARRMLIKGKIVCARTFWHQVLRDGLRINLDIWWSAICERRTLHWKLITLPGAVELDFRLWFTPRWYETHACSHEVNFC